MATVALCSIGALSALLAQVARADAELIYAHGGNPGAN
jgi:hypothetical protein